MFLAMIINSSWAQDKSNGALTSGKIFFEEKTRLEIKLEGDAAQFAGMLPKEQKSEKVLLFSNDLTLFEDSKNTEDEMSVQQGEGMRIRMVMSGQNKTFTDLKNRKVLEQRDFMNRIFLVEEVIPDSNWKISGNQKEILGYVCMEAFRVDSTGNRTVVWFAPTFTSRGGPARFNNLPGMVLEADINGGSRIYTAKSIEHVPQSELKLERPREGKKVTEEEYRTMVAEKMKEMGIEGGQSGGGGTHMQIVIKR